MDVERAPATLRAGALYTEVDEDGWVQRELGIGEDGLITHQLVPCDARPGWFGLARLSFAMLDSNVTKAEFESLWHAGSVRSGEILSALAHGPLGRIRASSGSSFGRMTTASHWGVPWLRPFFAQRGLRSLRLCVRRCSS